MEEQGHARGHLRPLKKMRGHVMKGEAGDGDEDGDGDGAAGGDRAVRCET